MSFANTKTPTKPTTKAKWPVPMRPNAKQPHLMEYYLEGELLDKFCKLFPKHSNRRIMQWFGIGFATMQRFKRELGLEKDMTAIRKELAKDVKKICEKNGYYDSLRGKAPCQAARDATAKLRAEGFHPWKRLKEINPRKFKRAQKKKAEKWRETRERDKRRVGFGFEPQTNFNHSFVKLSHTAIGQKHVMIKRNNYFSDPEHPSWVCYDKETKRSERSEATAVRHGLRIVQADVV